MSTKRLCLAILLLVFVYQQRGTGADIPATPANGAATVAELPVAEPDKQLKINRDALLKGPSEQMRIDAATVILFSKNPQARNILLDALKQSENSAARIAVCRALSQTRGTKEPIENKEDFIQPLIEILATEEDFTRAKWAAEATLIFEYEQISERLEKIVTDPALPARARLNTIEALKRPDIGALSKLVDLLDDSDKEVAGAAETTLISLGIPVSKDPKIREQIINDIKHQGEDEFRRSWEIRQQHQERMRELEKELEWWQKQYLTALDQIYKGKTDDVAKGRSLAEHLNDSKAIVRLWALEKVYQWWVGTGTKSNLLAELGPILVNLISDQNREVRLKTAKLLSLMGQLNSARQLAKQLEIEQDEEVRMEMFVALGEACRYAFQPNSGIEIPLEVRKQALERAVRYLTEQDPEKAQNGAEVIRKLLEQDGLTSGEVDRYLGLLAERYEKQNKADGALQEKLLSVMAGLCAQSAYKDKSAKLFKPLFEKALSDKTDLVRQAAADGLIFIDKTKALKKLREDFVNDTAITQKIINLAGEVGGKDDLDWLAEKIGTTAEGELAWQTMLRIFKSSSSDAAVLEKWIGEFESQAKLSDEQKLSLLEIAERKAFGEKKLKMLKSVREKLSQLYVKSGKFKQAAELLGKMREAASTVEEKEAILPDLLDVYLKWPNAERAVKLVDNCLLEKDLEPNSGVVLSIDNYLTRPPAGADPNEILEALSKIKLPEARPKWAEQLKRWADRFGQAKDADKPKEAGD